MPEIILRDGARLLSKDRGSGPPVGTRDAFRQMCLSVGVAGAYDCIAAFSETDVPVLLSHGDDDQIVPLEASSRRSMALIPNATLTVRPGAPHGLTGRFEQDFDAELLAFLSQ